MFSSSKKQPQGSGLLSLISPDTTIEGKLSCSGEIQIDGTVIGDVVAGKLVLGESGRIEGSIQTERLDVRGTIKGNIFSDEVNLRSSANVNGDIVQGSLCIEPGAVLQGNISRLPELQPEGDVTDIGALVQQQS